MPDIDELSVVLERRAFWRKTDKKVQVYGTPLHLSTKELLEKYQRTSLDAFLGFESRHGVGDYAIVDVHGSRARVITSPGYCGGYLRTTSKRFVIATTLRNVIAVDRDELTVDPAQLALLLSFNPRTRAGLLAHQGFFQSTVRFHAATVLEARHSGVISYRSYLHPRNSLDAPRNALEAVLETAQSAISANQLAQMPSTLMFSGGSDSLMILLAVMEVAGKDAVHPIAVRTARHDSTTNGHYRAVPVARALGIDLELLTDDWELSPAVIAEQVRSMKHDFVNLRKPDLALVSTSTSPVVLHGQNMDALVGNAMVTPEANWDRPMLSAEQLPLLDSDEKLLKQLRHFFMNLAFTQPYLEDETFQRWTAPFLAQLAEVQLVEAGLVDSCQVDPAVGTELGVIRGLIASQYPNLIGRPAELFSQFDPMGVFDSETRLAVDLIGEHLPMHQRVGALRYFGHSQLASKRGRTTSLPNGSRIIFFPSSGPMQSYFLNKRHALHTALAPKREIYEIIEKLSGKTYSQLKLALNDEDKARLKPITGNKLDPKQDALLDEYRHRLDPESSQLLPLLPDEETKELFVGVYSRIVKEAAPEAEKYSLLSQSLSRYLLNLELLLS